MCEPALLWNILFGSEMPLNEVVYCVSFTKTMQIDTSNLLQNYSAEHHSALPAPKQSCFLPDISGFSIN